MNAPRAEVLSLALGEIDLETFAARNGMTSTEAEAMRAAFVEGLKTGAGRAPRTSKFARWGLVTALVGTAAFAQLVVFQADTPAQASEVNANFNQLKTWLETKVGSTANAGVTATSVSATTLAATTSVSAPTVTTTTETVSGTLTAKTVQVNEDLTVSRNLTVSGTGGNTIHGCKVRGLNGQYVATCGAGEVAISGGGVCPFPGDAYDIVSSLPWNSAVNAVSTIGSMPDSWRVVCQIWGSNGNQVPPVSTYVLCCNQ